MDRYILKGIIGNADMKPCICYKITKKSLFKAFKVSILPFRNSIKVPEYIHRLRTENENKSISMDNGTPPPLNLFFQK